MHGKRRSLSVIAGIYLAALAVGYLTLLRFTHDSFMQSYLYISLIMTVLVFFFSLVFRNASVYDPYWSVIPPFLLLSRALFLSESLRLGTLLLLLALSFWGARLTYNWAKNWRGLRHQDWRYTMLMKKNPKTGFLINLLGIHLFPTLLVYFQLIGAMKVIGANPRLDAGLFLSVSIVIGATILQMTADQQMYRHRQDQANQAVFDQGLWRCSRHPNYFAEIMVWWGVYLAYVSVFRLIDAHLLAPLAMTGLFVFISIPMLEKKMVLKHPDYAEYQKRVSMLILIPKALSKRSSLLDEHIHG